MKINKQKTKYLKVHREHSVHFCGFIAITLGYSFKSKNISGKVILRDTESTSEFPRMMGVAK
jgi:hypothetical protein